MSNKAVLITGATGFLGSWIIARLIADGQAVVATDLVLDKNRIECLLSPEKSATVRWQTLDTTDSQALNTLVEEVRPTAIIHLAALQIPACRENPVLAAQVNIIGHINVFEAAKKYGIERLIYTSSIAAKPRGPDNAPSNLYGVFKKTDEEIARLYWQDFGISSLGLRPYIVYGLGRDEGETSAITKAIQAAALGDAYQMPFSTESCFQYAGEVAEIFARCINTTWQGALLSDLTTNIDSTDQLIAAIHAEVPDANITPSSNIRVSPTEGFDNSVLKRVIGDWPKTSLDEGVRETLHLFRSLNENQK